MSAAPQKGQKSGWRVLLIAFHLTRANRGDISPVICSASYCSGDGKSASLHLCERLQKHKT